MFPDENFDAEFARNPFTARVRPVTRLFPLPSPGFELTSAEFSRLHAQLPLVEPDDAHVLFVEVAPSHALGDLLRDDERLHVWLRRSDVTNRRYVDVVTFRKSAPRASAPLTRPARSGGLSA